MGTRHLLRLCNGAVHIFNHTAARNIVQFEEMKIAMHFIIFTTVYAVMVACIDIRRRWLERDLLHAKMHVSFDKGFLEGCSTAKCVLTPRSTLKEPEKWALSEIHHIWYHWNQRKSLHCKIHHFSSLFASIA